MKTITEKEIKITTSMMYTFNRFCMPVPKSLDEKIKPPAPKISYTNTDDLFKNEKEKTREEKMVEFMSDYKKAERTVVVNFYTGGYKSYRRGMMDVLYSGMLQRHPMAA